ncbi:hypothetical protein CASFOL_013460 [Castilleja foliolosa]|uniref:Uncharacterized protein n=1 Tax=Castilleja foliolosa TaxID=1961234 RepID=A0ABD3DK13_9LAMI
MAVLYHKFQRLLTKLRFKSGDHGHVYYKKLEFEKDEMKQRCCARGYVPVYVGEINEPKILYRVPTGAFNSPAFAALLDEYRDDIGDCCGPISVPCSTVDFERALRCAMIK